MGKVVEVLVPSTCLIRQAVETTRLYTAAVLTLRLFNASTPAKLLRALQIVLELLPPFLERLESQLPAMQLNAELIDVTSHLSPLRFVFLQLAP